MAKIDGVVSFGTSVRGKKRLVVSDEETGQEEEDGRETKGVPDAVHD